MGKKAVKVAEAVSCRKSRWCHPPRANRAPAHLSAGMRKWYASTEASYELDQHHRLLLQAAAEAWDRMADARAVLAKRGTTFDDRWGGAQLRPEIAIERDARVAFCRCLRELAVDVSAPDEPRPPGLGRR